jgi:hypothetical protein
MGGCFSIGLYSDVSRGSVLVPYGLLGTEVSLVRLEGLHMHWLYKTKPVCLLSVVSKPFYVCCSWNQ